MSDPDTDKTADQADASALPTCDRKRPRENDDSPPKSSKCQKTDQIPAGSSTDGNAINLLDVNIDCLERIFDYLNYNDLVKVADLDANAQIAAKLVFARRYSHFLVEMYTDHTVRSVETTHSTLVLSTVSECAKILRHFGKSIKKLELNNFSDRKMAHNWNAIKNLIDKNCTKTLIELKLLQCGKQLSDGMKNVFENVEMLRLQSTSLGKWKELNIWFPKLKRLELIDTEKAEKFIITPLTLPDFEITHISAVVYLSKSEIKTMIKSVPQLHTLTLTGHLNTNDLHFINDHLLTLKHLILINFEFSSDSENSAETKVFFKNLETLSMMGTTFKGDIPFAFKQLNELDINVAFMATEWIDFATQQRDLIKLRLKWRFSAEITERHVNEIVTNLTKLTEIHLDINSEMPLDHVVALLDCESLTKLEVVGLPPNNGQRAVALATRKWRFCKNDQQAVFTRESTGSGSGK